jgi:glycerate kinase
VKVVLAVDKFKGSASSTEVATALRRGLRAVRPDVGVVEMPVGDGGDGSLDALLRVGFVPAAATARGPLGAERSTRFGLRGEEAFIELAEVCGLQLLPAGRLHPWRSSTYGLGQVIRAALDRGARRVVIGLGGSASTDGGLGMLLALGARIRDGSGRDVSPDASGMAAAASLDLRGLDRRIADVSFIAATDVQSPLTGPHGAAAVFAPQKGATPADVTLLERGLQRWAVLLLAADGRPADVPGAGAAGGVGAAIVSALRGAVTSGADLILDRTGFDESLLDASLVVTGEGSWDAQTGDGKLPGRVLDRAGRAGVPVIIVAGRIAPYVDFPAHVRERTALVDLEPTPSRAMARARELLEEVGRGIGRRLPTLVGGPPLAGQPVESGRPPQS